MIEKKRGEKWSTLLHSEESTRYIPAYIKNKSWHILCVKLRERARHKRVMQLERVGKSLESKRHMKYGEMRQLHTLKRTQEHKSIENRAHKRELANSPDLHKHKSKQRYYTYEGVLYPYVRGKIPSKHSYKFKRT